MNPTLTYWGEEPDWEADDIPSIVDRQLTTEAYAQAMDCDFDNMTYRMRLFVSR